MDQLKLYQILQIVYSFRLINWYSSEEAKVQADNLIHISSKYLTVQVAANYIIAKLIGFGVKLI